VTPLALQLSPEFPQAIAAALADELERRGVLGAQAISPWLDVDETVDYIRASGRQRVYDLVNEGKLTPARDGRRLLFNRSALDAYLTGGAP
jgi:excisionase family DNA binding protein